MSLDAEIELRIKELLALRYSPQGWSSDEASEFHRLTRERTARTRPIRQRTDA